MWDMENEPLDILKFPCDFPLKVIGVYNEVDDFETFALEIINRHVPELDPTLISRRLSNGGKYVALSVNFVAQSREQVDQLYIELGSHKRVLMIL